MSKAFKTIELSCNGETHTIIVSKNRQITLLNHTDPEEIKAETVIYNLGGKACTCVMVQLTAKENNYGRGMIKNSRLYKKHKVDPIGAPWLRYHLEHVPFIIRSVGFHGYITWLKRVAEEFKS